ncbi:echinoderm microtubule-associated protein-like 2 isoform X2 [Condylostylus longicornis]|uniref:echinoderm microtubule-associated protein-like 2 isoform X2 n=1 Tax=Condylostylus longicornis TaxID=2530218 RepID=UPI00244DE109|nr:echinoderm microtubule-associated protein-like 2 isoform X2 [Condylostylus longicornis]
MNGHRSNGNDGIHYDEILEEETIVTSSSASSLSTVIKLNKINENGNGNGNVTNPLSSRLTLSSDNDGFSTDEMLESEKSSLAGRVHDLERRVLTQQDEIVCLRSTLADVLRRLNLIEGNIERNTNSTTSHHYNSQTDHHSTYRGGRSAPSTPARSAPVPSFNRLTSPSPTNNSSSSTASSNEWKLRKPLPRSTPNYHHQTESSAVRRHQTVVSSATHGTTTQQNYNNNNNNYNTNHHQQPHNRNNKLHHQSNGSLHSDSHSSSSVSPAPSPSPRPNTVNHHVGLGKRWSSTGDFQNGGVGAGVANGSGVGVVSTIGGSSLQGSTHTATYNDEEGSVKMFLRGRPLIFFAPSDVKDSYDITKVQPAPSRKLKLDWVYGYRGKDCRSNLYQLPTGEMVYFVAAAVVLYNADEQCQRHYLGHTDDVKSLAVHPNKLLVATGQCAGHDKRDATPHVRVWNSVSLATIAVIGAGDFTGSVNCLSFSRADGGANLAVIDDSPEKIISVWDWQKGEKGVKITETRCSVDTVVAVEYHPLERNQIITVGKSHVAFWTLDHSGALYKKMGIFESREKPKYVTCIAFNQSGDVITGDSSGNIVVWGRGTNTISRFFKKVHEGPIFSLCALKDGGLISGGGKDSRIIIFDEDMNRADAEGFIEPHFGGIRVINEGKGSQILVGTTRNCILIGSLDLGFNPVVMGHTEEIWGLAVHPNMAQFVTGGFDQLLQLWDALSHSVVWSKDIGEQIQSCAFSPDGELIAVGGITGRWMIFDAQTREMLAQFIDGQEPIQAIQFSPDGQFLVIASRDNFLYVYQIDGSRFSKVGRCSGHSSFIKHVDWSEDNQMLRSNSGDYETLYWNSGTCRQITSNTAIRDVSWSTNTCTLTFNSIGIWPEHADGTDVNSAASSHDKSLIASGDDFGRVRLFVYPAMQPKSLAHNYNGHSSHVTSVGFLHDDTRLISTGGNDTSVMQWEVM